MHLIRSGAIEGYLQLVNRHKQNPSPILQQTGISAAQLHQPDALISYERLADLLDYTSEQCMAPYFSLHLAAPQSPLVIGDVALLSGHQDTFLDTISVSKQYIHLHAMGVHTDLQVKGDWAEWSLRFDFTNTYGLGQLIQLSAGQMFNGTASALGDHLSGLTLHLCQPEAIGCELPAVYREFLVFDSHFDGVRFPASWLVRKPVSQEIQLREYFQQHMQLLDNLYPDNLQAQVRFIISNLLPSGECTLERVSEALDLHPRLLQRRLKQEEISFRELLQQTRRDTAEQFLFHGKISITDLALNLGYAEVAVFSRHFKQWTGLSPREWQKQQRAQQKYPT
jgi:AraC-like DNA-binding protein